MKRKHLLFLLIVLSSSQVTLAQIKKGSIFLGGSAFITTYKANTNYPDDDRKHVNYSFFPAAGKFVEDNLVWGGELQLAGFNYDLGFDRRHKNFTVGAGTFVRKYFPLVNRLYIFGQARFGISYIREKTRGAGDRSDSKGYSVGVSAYPGMSFAISKKIYLETGLANLVTVYYAHKKITQTMTPTFLKTNDFHFGTSLDSETGLTVGIRVII
jgi:hypothetical protein